MRQRNRTRRAEARLARAMAGALSNLAYPGFAGCLFAYARHIFEVAGQQAGTPALPSEKFYCEVDIQHGFVTVSLALTGEDSYKEYELAQLITLLVYVPGMPEDLVVGIAMQSKFDSEPYIFREDVPVPVPCTYADFGNMLTLNVSELAEQPGMTLPTGQRVIREFLGWGFARIHDWSIACLADWPRITELSDG